MVSMCFKTQKERKLLDISEKSLETLATYEIFSILSHPIRMEILKRINIGTRTYSDLVSIFDQIESSKVNFHLKKLIRSNIIVKIDKEYELSNLGFSLFKFLEKFEFNRNLNPEFLLNEDADLNLEKESDIDTLFENMYGYFKVDDFNKKLKDYIDSIPAETKLELKNSFSS